MRTPYTGKLGEILFLSLRSFTSLCLSPHQRKGGVFQVRRKGRKICSLLQINHLDEKPPANATVTVIAAR